MNPRLSPLSLPPGRLLLALLLPLSLAGGCGGGAGEDGDPGTPATSPVIEPGSREVQRDIRDLVTALTPLPATATHTEQGEWHRRRREILERQRAGGADLGREALRVYLERPDAPEKVRVGLLDVAAHNIPERTRPILEELVTTFGAGLELRTAACPILAQTSPAAAVEVLGAILREDRPSTTYPPLDGILAAWLQATGAEKVDPVETLAVVATDLLRETNVRTAALRALGEHEGPAGRQALETVLVESTGNQYLRKVAVQSLHATLPRVEFCALINEVLSKEADMHFQEFLADNLEQYCR